jgi:serine/threonine protein kinase
MSELDVGATIRGLRGGQRCFHRFTLVRLLGRGGMGVVWLAQDDALERNVALKFLPDLVVNDAAALDELKVETKRSLQLTHHNIVRIYDFVQDADSACISMEYVDGLTLSALRVDQPGKVFDVHALGPWIRQACEALQYAHESARIAHRDIKPANLMLNGKGELKVADFGIARSLSDSVSSLTLVHGASGTLAYMSPQQITGERATHLDDIYSIGATIYELLTGKPPFYSGDITDQIKTKSPEPMSQRRTNLNITSEHGIPVHWEDTIRACLAKLPQERPQHAAEIIQRLGLIGREPPTVTTSVPPPLVAVAPPVIAPPPPVIAAPPPPVIHRSRNAPVLIVSSAIVIGLALVSYSLLSRRESKIPERSAVVQPSALVSPTQDTPPKLRESARTLAPAPDTQPVAPALKEETIAVQTPARVIETRATVAPTTQPVSPPASSGSTAEEQYPETRTRLLTANEARIWSDAKLRYAINELYARGGYDFLNAEIKANFSRFAWYRQRLVPGRSQQAAAAQLSRLEYANLELLQKIRDSRR